MEVRAKKRAVAILRALQEAGRPLGASRLARDIEAMGFDMSQRTVRYYLAMLDRDNLTRSCGKKGREITPLGEQELVNSFAAEKVGLISARVDELAYQMTFQPRRGTGTIILNISSFPLARAAEAATELLAAYEGKLAMGRFLAIGRPGSVLGQFRVPPDRVAIGTLCSVTVNGVLLSEGIPVTSRFGGLLEMSDGQPLRFTEMIYYDGTSLDPLEVFISGHMTRVREAVRTRRGIIGVGFREIPAAAVPKARKVAARLETLGLGSILAIGKPNRPLLEIPVPMGRAGMIVVGGLNPVAAVEEAGIPTHNRAMTGLFDFERLVPYQQLRELEGIAAAADGVT